MGRYRAADLVRVPGLLSLSRVPLAVAFACAVHRPPVAYAILVAAGATDVLDGWYARHFGQVTPTGSVIDPITDKIFVTTVAISLVVTGQLNIAAVLLLSTRELGELPLVVWLALSHELRQSRADHTGSNLAGKLATAFQFASVTAALFRAPGVELWVYATAVVGCWAAFSYWKRALRTRALRPKAAG